MQSTNKMPKPIRISRKLDLSSEQLVVMVRDTESAGPVRCTKRNTGCGPVHTC